MQRNRLSLLHDLPCIACTLERCTQPLRTEAHHIVSQSYRKHSGGDAATIPLCSWHHRGELLYPLSSREMTELYGPSFARQKRAFIANYGTERELLALTNKQLERAA